MLSIQVIFRLAACAAVLMSVWAWILLWRRRPVHPSRFDPGALARTANALREMVGDDTEAMPEQATIVSIRSVDPMRRVCAATLTATMLAVLSLILSWITPEGPANDTIAARRPSTAPASRPAKKEPLLVISVFKTVPAKPEMPVVVQDGKPAVPGVKKIPPAAATAHQATDPRPIPPVHQAQDPIEIGKDRRLGSKQSTSGDEGRVPLSIDWPPPSEMPAVIEALGLQLALAEEPLRELRSKKPIDPRELGRYSPVMRVLKAGSLEEFDQNAWMLVPVDLANRWDEIKSQAIREAGVRAAAVEGKVVWEESGYGLQIVKVVPRQ